MITKILFRAAMLFFTATLVLAGCGGSTGNGNNANTGNRNNSNGNRINNGNRSSINTNNSTDPNSPTAAIRNFHRYGENNDAKAMCGLYSNANLEKNRKSLEDGCRFFADPKKRAESFGNKPMLYDLEEISVGEKVVVKGFYGTREGGEGRGAMFQARLVKENGEWKIEKTTASPSDDLTKE